MKNPETLLKSIAIEKLRTQHRVVTVRADAGMRDLVLAIRQARRPIGRLMPAELENDLAQQHYVERWVQGIDPDDIPIGVAVATRRTVPEFRPYRPRPHLRSDDMKDMPTVKSMGWDGSGVSWRDY